MSTTPTTAVVNVTPAQAAEWLAKNNTHNRTIREGKVAMYARDMANGDWKFNGDTIRFSSDGTLMDGQHRLAAIVRADVTIACIVVWGLDSAAQDTMDIGAHRMLRDQLLLRGEANAHEMASIARRVITVERGAISTGNAGKYAPTHAEMIRYIESHPDIRRAAEVAVRVKGRRLPASPSSIGTAYLMCSRLDESDAEMFYVVQVIDGIGLFEGDPAYALRSRFMSEYAGGRQMDPEDVYRYSIVAWNGYQDGKKLTKLQAPRGGWTSLPQPKLRKSKSLRLAQ